MKVSIMQPNIFMWNGLASQLCDSDLHIILDHVKASKNEIYNRNRIAGIGSSCWLTIPIANFSRNKKISELNLDLSISSRKKLENLFGSRYSKAPLYSTSNSIFLATLASSSDTTSIVSTYMRFLDALRRVGLPICRVVRSSEIVESDPHLLQHQGVELVNSLLHAVSASTYLAAQNTVLYASREDYRIKEIKIQRFVYQEYSQHQRGIHPRDFVPNLSCLDTLSFLTIEAFTDYLKRSNSWYNL